MSHQMKILLAVALCAPAITVSAAEPSRSVQTGVATFGQLDELRSQNAVLAEEVKAAELRAKLGAAAAASKTSAAPMASPMSEPRARPVQRPVEPAPLFATSSSAQVQMVSGVGDALVAHLAMQNGSVMPVRVGMTVPGVGVVRSISINEVLVANKKQTIVIPFASDAMTVSAGVPAPAPVRMPMPSSPFGTPISIQMPPLPPDMMSGAR
jgi:type IV pilus biogenesis protein PilP